MAEAFGKMLGAAVFDSYSSGSNPSGVVNPKAIAAMQELGYDLTQHNSKSLDEIPDIEYDLVVTMGCGDRCPTVRGKQREDWAIPDPKQMPPVEFRKVCDLIRDQVTVVVTRLRA